jgi:hypothetical protein
MNKKSRKSKKKIEKSINIEKSNIFIKQKNPPPLVLRPKAVQTALPAPCLRPVHSRHGRLLHLHVPCARQQASVLKFQIYKKIIKKKI